MITTLAQLNRYIALRAQAGKPVPQFIIDVARAHLQPVSVVKVVK